MKVKKVFDLRLKERAVQIQVQHFRL